MTHFTFDLTCDVISDPKVNEITFLSTIFTGLSNCLNFVNLPSSSGGARGLKIGPPTDDIIIRPHHSVLNKKTFKTLEIHCIAHHTNAEENVLIMSEEN